MRDLVYKLHRRLLPDDEDVGWVPYLWLVYLGAFIIPLFNPRFSTLERILSVAALGVFLGAYFHAYWTQGPRTLLPIAVLVLLGAGFAPFNTGAIVFFIYGASFAALVGPPRTGLKVLGAILAVIVVEGVLVPLKMWSVAPALVISTLIGLVNLYYVELGRKKRALALSADEIRKLAATAERERIARDLHDLLGHTLSVIALKSELASRLVTRDVARAAEEIRDVERISREALAEVRAAVTGYRSGGLAAEVIGARLALAAAGVTFTWETEGTEPSAALEATSRSCSGGGHERRAARERQELHGAARGPPGPSGARSERRRTRRAIPRALRAPRHARAREGGRRGDRAPRRRGNDRGREPAGRLRSRARGSRGSGFVIRVLLAEDQSMVLGALAALLSLEGDLEVVGRPATATRPEARRGAPPRRPRDRHRDAREDGPRARDSGARCRSRRAS
jgi:two-component system sensor histidine kinase DesK